MSIAENLSAVQQRIADKARRVGRAPEEITLVAVSKTFGAPLVDEAASAGQIHFGENRVQEAEDKIPLIRQSGLVWHMIGHLQRNKAKRAVQLFDWIHSVDSQELLCKLDQHAGALGKRTLVLLQLGLAGEETKSGMTEMELEGALDCARSRRNLSVEGLMTIPPFYDNPQAARPFFKRLRQLLEYSRRRAPDLPLRHLSMGMTHDFEVAIEEGATLLRVGTAIFG
ncbi:MAG: YggS family pyridoxal phosphate-dependent enzyme, partial [Acidobacteria bacterium]|nr:YggS family pyridoxal phosphate-dependent enzyme [Acidobacteriota bacterium]